MTPIHLSPNFLVVRASVYTWRYVLFCVEMFMRHIEIFIHSFIRSGSVHPDMISALAWASKTNLFLSCV